MVNPISSSSKASIPSIESQRTLQLDFESGVHEAVHNSSITNTAIYSTTSQQINLSGPIRHEANVVEGSKIDLGMLAIVKKASQIYTAQNLQKESSGKSTKRPRIEKPLWDRIILGAQPGASEDNQKKAAESLVDLAQLCLQKIASTDKKSLSSGHKQKLEANKRKWEAVHEGIKPGALESVQKETATQLEGLITARKKNEQDWERECQRKKQGSLVAKPASLDTSFPNASAQNLISSNLSFAATDIPFEIRDEIQELPEESRPGELVLEPAPLGFSFPSAPAQHLISSTLIMPSFTATNIPHKIRGEIQELPEELANQLNVEPVSSAASKQINSRRPTKFRRVVIENTEATAELLAMIEKASQIYTAQNLQKESSGKSTQPPKIEKPLWDRIISGAQPGASEDDQKKAAESLVDLAQLRLQKIASADKESFSSGHKQKMEAHQRKWEVVHEGIKPGALKDVQKEAVTQLRDLIRLRKKKEEYSEREKEKVGEHLDLEFGVPGFSLSNAPAENLISSNLPSFTATDTPHEIQRLPEELRADELDLEPVASAAFESRPIRHEANKVEGSKIDLGMLAVVKKASQIYTAQNLQKKSSGRIATKQEKPLWDKIILGAQPGASEFNQKKAAESLVDLVQLCLQKITSAGKRLFDSRRTRKLETDKPTWEAIHEGIKPGALESVQKKTVTQLEGIITVRKKNDQYNAQYRERKKEQKTQGEKQEGLVANPAVLGFSFPNAPAENLISSNLPSFTATDTPHEIQELAEEQIEQQLDLDFGVPGFSFPNASAENLISSTSIIPSFTATDTPHEIQRLTEEQLDLEFGIPGFSFPNAPAENLISSTSIIPSFTATDTPHEIQRLTEEQIEQQLDLEFGVPGFSFPYMPAQNLISSNLPSFTATDTPHEMQNLPEEQIEEQLDLEFGVPGFSFSYKLAQNYTSAQNLISSNLPSFTATDAPHEMQNLSEEQSEEQLDLEFGVPGFSLPYTPAQNYTSAQNLISSNLPSFTATDIPHEIQEFPQELMADELDLEPVSSAASEQTNSSRLPKSRRVVIQNTETTPELLAVIEKAFQFYKPSGNSKQDVLGYGQQKTVWNALFKGTEPGASEDEQKNAGNSVATLTQSFCSFYSQKLNASPNMKLAPKHASLARPWQVINDIIQLKDPKDGLKQIIAKELGIVMRRRKELEKNNAIHSEKKSVKRSRAEIQDVEEEQPIKRRRFVTQSTKANPAILAVIRKAFQFYRLPGNSDKDVLSNKQRKPFWDALFQGIEPGASEDEQTKAGNSVAMLTQSFCSFYSQKSSKEDSLRRRWQIINDGIKPGAGQKEEEAAAVRLESAIRTQMNLQNKSKKKDIKATSNSTLEIGSPSRMELEPNRPIDSSFQLEDEFYDWEPMNYCSNVETGSPSRMELEPNRPIDSSFQLEDEFYDWEPMNYCSNVETGSPSRMELEPNRPIDSSFQLEDEFYGGEPMNYCSNVETGSPSSIDSEPNIPIDSFFQQEDAL